MKISIYATLALAATLFLAGLAVGWVLAGQAGWTLAGNDGEAAGGTPPTVEEPPPAVAPEMPAEDVPGGDVPGLPRYPGSVRVEHIREDLGDVVATEVEYLTPAELDEVQDFYRGTFRTEGWYVGDVGFSRGAWTFFVIRDEREAFIEIKPRGGGLAEIDMEMTEAKKGAPAPDKPSLDARPGPPQRTAPVQQPSGPVYDEDADDLEEGGDD